MTASKTLKQIVAERDLRALESFALFLGTYARLIAHAEKHGVDLELLEELLCEIS